MEPGSECRPRRWIRGTSLVEGVAQPLRLVAFSSPQRLASRRQRAVRRRRTERLAVGGDFMARCGGMRFTRAVLALPYAREA